MHEYEDIDRGFEEDENGNYQNYVPPILRDEVYGDPRDWKRKQARPGIIGMRSHISPGQIHGRGHSDSYIQARSDARRRLANQQSI